MKQTDIHKSVVWYIVISIAVGIVIGLLDVLEGVL